MELVNCNLCGSSQSRLVYRMPDALFFPERWFDVVECVSCGLGFVNPRPDRTEIAEYYPSAFFSTFEHPAHQQRYEAEARFLAIPNGSTQPLLLDVGCANGGFPRYMRAHGWEVEGVETAPNAVPIEDFPIYRAQFTDIPVASARYDAITAWAVLEHIHDPAAYFRKAAQLLKPGGKFVFLVTNFDSLSSRALFREDVPRHLYFFSPATLTRYIENSGLRALRFTQSRNIFEMVPSNILYYAFYRFVLRRQLRWEHLPETRDRFIRRVCGQTVVQTAEIGWRLNLQYALRHPLAMVDRIAAKLFEQWQLRSDRYGIVVCVAQKPQSR